MKEAHHQIHKMNPQLSKTCSLAKDACNKHSIAGCWMQALLARMQVLQALLSIFNWTWEALMGCLHESAIRLAFIRLVWIELLSACQLVSWTIPCIYLGQVGRSQAGDSPVLGVGQPDLSSDCCYTLGLYEGSVDHWQDPSKLSATARLMWSHQYVFLPVHG